MAHDTLIFKFDSFFFGRCMLEPTLGKRTLTCKCHTPYLLLFPTVKLHMVFTNLRSQSPSLSIAH